MNGRCGSMRTRGSRRHGRIWAVWSTLVLGIIGATSTFSMDLTLREAVDLALRNNEKIRQYDERVEQRRWDDRTALGNFLPSLRLEAGYNHLNDPLQIDLNPVRQVIISLQAANQTELTNLGSILHGNPALTPEERAAMLQQYAAGLNAAIPPFVETLKDQDYKSASLVATQPIFLGGKLIAAKKAAAAEKRAAESELERTKNEIVQETVNNYLAVAFTEQLVALRLDVLEGVKQHRDQASALVREGLVAPYQSLRAEVAVANAERNLFDDRNRRDLAQVALRHSLALDDTSHIQVTDSMIYRQVQDSLASYRSQAQSEQPMLQLVREKRTAAAQKYNVERSEFLPRLAAFGRYEMVPEDLSALEPRWVVGLRLDFSLFDGGRRATRLQSAKHLRNEVGYMERYASRQVDLWVEKAYREMRNAEERYLRLAPSIALAQESLRQSEKRFGVGLCTSLEVVDAHLELERNKVERLASLYEYYRAMTDLAVAAGNPAHVLDVWQHSENDHEN
jgi:outer membrane protein TolC